eukprot:s1592_g18.t1
MVPRGLKLPGWWLWLLPQSNAIINVSMKPAIRDIPPGHVAHWMWQGPGRVQVNASCMDGSRLDFYVISGDAAEMRRRQRGQHTPVMKDHPDCQGCSEFRMESDLPLLDRNVTMMVASNQDGTANVRMQFTESLLDVPSCMDRCFGRPWGFVGLALMLALLLACCFHLSRPMMRRERDGDDEAWAPQLVQCRRPPKPREAWRSWILHGCIMTYPWNPWYNDPLEYPLRCLVLMVSLGLTMFISTLYGHFFSYWDSSISLGSMESVAENSEPEMSTSMQGALEVSILCAVIESVLRMLALALFRSSLACSRLQKRWHAQAPALVLATAVVMFCIAYPLGLATSAHLCGYVRHLSAQFLMSQLIRGLPMALAVTSFQYLLLKAWGKAIDRGEPAMGLTGEMAELGG